MDLAPHLWSVACMGRSGMTVQFHDVVTVEQFGSRKALAAHCENVISQGVSDAIGGRLRPARRRGWWPTKPLYADIGRHPSGPGAA